MAAFDTPWLNSMPSSKGPENGSPLATKDFNPPTTASFSPAQSLSSNRQRQTILVHQNSPLLTATPPQITRALAFSHPFILPLNKLLGLISWSSGDPWESFLLVGVFWAIILYGDTLIRWAGPIVVVVGLMAGMYSRRYSPLSTTSLSGEKVAGHNRTTSEGAVRHQKSLDEIVETVNVFTSRCNILLDPLLQLTDFLSTQRTPTLATTRPALTSLFLRILMVLPIWIGLTLPPLQLITGQRVVMVVGTLFLTWHSRPARIARTLLWRSLTVRRTVSVTTGLSFVEEPTAPQDGIQTARRKSQHDLASSLAIDQSNMSGSGVRFTFSVYENQRRWLGLGWTTSMFAYERGPWTDEHLNSSSPKEDFKLPSVEGVGARWQWVPGSEWRTEGATKANPTSSGKNKNDGWIYYDNKWNDGRRQDGWGRYTRRRKWFRDAELVDYTPSIPPTPSELPGDDPKTGGNDRSTSALQEDLPNSPRDADDASTAQPRRRGFFRRNSRASGQSSAYSNRTHLTSEDDADHRSIPDRPDAEGDWLVGDEMKMGLS